MKRFNLFPGIALIVVLFPSLTGWSAEELGTTKLTCR